MKEVKSVLHKFLQQKFGFDHFKPGQEEIIDSVLSGQHTLGILPTGSGKSLCYQLPTYINEKPTLIISPLISLMDDQVMHLKLNGEKQVACIHSGMDEVEKRHNIKMLQHSRFIFLSPEFILQPFNFKLIATIDIGLIVLDEAHCLSEWGYDFRPHYALIGKVTKHFHKATILALTATAPSHLRDDLKDMLGVDFEVIKTTMNRPNITFSHLNFNDDSDKINWLLSFLEYSGPTIIYVSSKKLCHQLAQHIYNHGYLTGIYHGDMNYQERQTVQQQFLNNEIPVIVATSAFGMGVNKKDIRTIVHFHLSSSPSNYLQEIGRAGRDGQPSQAISLYQPDDSFILETLLFSDMITDEDIHQFSLGQLLSEEKQNILATLASYYSINALTLIFNQSFKRKQLGFYRMLGYTNLDQCRRRYLLEFFKEVPPKQQQCCDIDDDIDRINIKNKKEVVRKLDVKEKLQNLF
nr:ATP-dependent DNA helicase RecQ [Staphylococcus simiae]